MVLLVEATPGAALAPMPGTRSFPAQLNLMFEDARLLGLMPAERQNVVKTLARLLLEAGGAAVREVGDERPC